MQGQGANFQTMPSTPGSGPLTNPNTPAHQRGQNVSQTMYNPRRSIPNQGGAGMQLYDAPNCDYEPPKNFQQNFGNPYDCPEGFYNGSMRSSQGYSQVSDYQAHPGMQPGMQGPGMPGGQQMMLPGQILAQQAMMQQMQQQQMERAQRAQPHEEYSTDTVIYKGGPPAQQPPPPAAGKLRGPLPASGEDEFPPPPPERSADTSLNDSNSTTQSNVTSECSEAECDREHLLKDSSPRASPEDPAQELTTEEMRKLIERNEIVPTTGLKPYNTV